MHILALEGLLTPDHSFAYTLLMPNASKEIPVEEPVDMPAEEEVLSLPVMGTCTYSDVLEKYADVYEKISTMESILSRGEVSVTVYVGKSPVVIRTLRRREAQALGNPLIAGPLSQEVTLESLMRTGTYQLLMSLVSVDGRAIVIPRVGSMPMEDWLKSPEVVQGVAFIEDMDELDSTFLLSACDELHQVKSLFLRRADLKNS